MDTESSTAPTAVRDVQALIDAAGRWTDQDLTYAVRLAYNAGRHAHEATQHPDRVACRECWHAGRLDALHRIGEHDRVWRPAARRADTDRIRQRLADMEEAADQRWAKRFPDRPRVDHPGGPVDWNTGRPAEPTYLPARIHRPARRIEGEAA